MLFKNSSLSYNTPAYSIACEDLIGISKLWRCFMFCILQFSACNVLSGAIGECVSPV